MLSLYAKTQKNAMGRFFITLEKPHFGPISGLFRP